MEEYSVNNRNVRLRVDQFSKVKLSYMSAIMIRSRKSMLKIKRYYSVEKRGKKVMNLKEKLILVESGQPYNGLDSELVELETKAAELTDKMNYEKNSENKEKIIRDLFGSVGVSPVVSPTFRCGIGSNIYIGDNFFANYDCMILDGSKVTIGNNVLFGPKVGLYTTNHLIDHEERSKGGCVAKPITIGNDCWLAADVSVLPGVTIGDNTIIGAGSVVTHDMPNDIVAVGNPCRVIRKITPEDRTGFLDR